MRKEEFARIVFDLGMTQKAFAEALGVDASTVSRWLTGEITISNMASFAIKSFVSLEGEDQCHKDE